MLNTIIFDLDGTLLNTLDDLYLSVNHALAYFNQPQRSKMEVRSFLGNGIRKLIEQSMPLGSDLLLIEKVFDEFRHYYLEHSLDYTQPYPDVIPMLKRCKEMGYKSAIVSNKLNQAVQDLHQRFFANYIDVAIGETPNVARKPAPDMLNRAIRKLQTTHQESIYVGDSEVDLQTASNATLSCISVAWGFRDRGFLEYHDAHTIIDSPMELFQYLDIPHHYNSCRS